MITTIHNLLRDESGVTMIEYGLIAALVSVVAIGSLQLIGTSLSSMFTTVSTDLQNAVSATP